MKKPIELMEDKKYTYPVLRISGCTLYSLANTNGTIPCGSAACICFYNKILNIVKVNQIVNYDVCYIHKLRYV